MGRPKKPEVAVQNPQTKQPFKENHPVLYWILIILKNISVFALGLVMGFVFSDKGLYLEHSGYIHKFNGHQITTFEYIDFKDITKRYPINKTFDDQSLTIHSKWIDQVWARTEIKVDNVKDGLKISCYADKTREPCDKYKFAPRDSVAIKIVINTGTAKANDYKNICFKTFL